MGRAGQPLPPGTLSGYSHPMTAPVLEIAMLQVRPGQTADFEAAFAEARRIIAARS